MKSIIIELPLPTIKIKGVTKNLTMNIYRNANWRDLNRAKKQYSEIVQVMLLPHRRKHFKKARICVTLYNKNKSRRDLSNFCSVVDKFVLDVMVKMKIIKDDDCFTVSSTNYEFGGVSEDKIIVEIKEI